MHTPIGSGDLTSSLTHPNESSTSPRALGSLAHGEHAAFLEHQYENWKLDPSQVDPTWRAFFEGFELGCQTPPPRLEATTAQDTTPTDPSGLPHRLRQARIYNLLFAYRTLGHANANLDPLGFENPTVPELDISHFKFTEADLDTYFDSGTLSGGGDRTLREIVQILRETYCGTVGVEYMHIQNFTIRRWLRDRMEKCRNKPNFSTERRKRILTKLLSAELFENFLQTKYTGQKRFSLEGGETLIPVLDAVVEGSPQRGISHLVIGMAHRGRLNVLANILNKSYRSIFTQFAENFVPESVQGDGDVKYHLGYDARVTTSSGDEVGISLAPNPSHLEAVDPVVEGKARAWQRRLNDTEERTKVLPILIHGDAAMIGQGVVMETFNLSQLEGYRTGGTIHIVVNNQIGFTTLPKDARSSVYCTSIAKMIGAPIFHINGDDPEAACHIMDLALDYRQRFHRDIVLDIYCYRRHGHNEGDEPSFTQPVLYAAIEKHPRISAVYLKKLVNDGAITEAEASAYRQKFENLLNDALAESKADSSRMIPAIRPVMRHPELLEPVDTSVDPERLRRVGHSITKLPENFEINKKLIRLIKSRRDMVDGIIPVDWAMAEHLAFGTLLDEGIPVRLSGQDSRRGTFSQRHSVLYDTKDRRRYIPLQNISPNQASFCVYNSPLSEFAVLGFEFGYSLDYPNMLCLWEAQFGDFANGAQVIIDQYITSSESKWGVTSGITLLLPHGYDGQGPEHSSARIERFLQACAEHNIIVANCSTPASYFHILRRQALRPLKKPLILMTPKATLRDKRCVSTLEDLCHGSFQEVLPDPEPPAHTQRVILCSGKIFFDLLDYRREIQDSETVIIRIEQLYPLHEAKLQKLLEPHAQASRWIWCQEESQNMGAWSHLEPRLRALTGKDWTYAGRDASSSPATGYASIHKVEQADVCRQAFTL